MNPRAEIQRNTLGDMRKVGRVRSVLSASFFVRRAVSVSDRSA